MTGRVAAGVGAAALAPARAGPTSCAGRSASATRCRSPRPGTRGSWSPSRSAPRRRSTDPDARLAALDGHAAARRRAGPRRSLHVLAECRRRALGRACAPARTRRSWRAHRAETGSQLLDLDGDAQVDLLVGTAGGAPPGYYANGEGDGWDGFVAYPRGRPRTPPFEGGRTRLADLDGDGRVDAAVRRLAGCARAGATKRREGWTLAGAARLGDGEAAPDVVSSGTRSCAPRT